MKKTLILLISLMVAACGGEKKSDKQNLSGAGASFPFPAYSKWAYAYHTATGIQINYQSVGSGAGVAQIKKKTVDFGASDSPMKAADLDKNGLMQFPMLMGGVVVAFNVPGIESGKLKLTPELLSSIFRCKIKKWNDPALVAANGDLKLPDKEISIVHRADGSGTTWIFTNYLSKADADWKKDVGTGKAVKWPCGIGGKGNEGVAANIKKIEGAIGYVEYAYSLQNNIPFTQLKNKAGKFVSPSSESFSAAAANADWEKTPGFAVVLTDQPGDQSWPITGATFILIHKEQSSAAKAKGITEYFRWCYKNGNASALKLHYVPMPPKVVELVEKQWKNITVGGKKVF
ncbi:phosphate ABC transporter substrate-binding protein PstS [Myxococcota bacterium]|nr:phosphate ABC transporter substrate-binding protein PstS [Myxococcota bacterium]MBU1379904.1 phosphate ABC transporter substrate-binding protein PstS [Myxococcota bacterium]MBU1497854.1 phosphate ABC transporter substrate-binding protein PstS [Myxococcota bacterium]